MKKRHIFIILTVILIGVLLNGCSEQNITKNFGGSMTINLPANQKLEEITWKDDSNLWYLTRPMRDDEEAETHVFQQSSDWGIIEGSITIIETREEK